MNALIPYSPEPLEVSYVELSNIFAESTLTRVEKNVRKFLDAESNTIEEIIRSIACSTQQLSLDFCCQHDCKSVCLDIQMAIQRLHLFSQQISLQEVDDCKKPSIERVVMVINDRIKKLQEAKAAYYREGNGDESRSPEMTVIYTD